jgi:hypothetical protein
MQKISDEIKKVFESRISFRILCGLGIVIAALLIFMSGVAVGFHKASYGRAWGENYNENFGMGRHSPTDAIGRMGIMDYFPNAHGATGKIIKVELPNIIMQDKDGTEKIISTNSGTIMQKGRISITPADLQIDDFVVVIGTPDAQGVIEAKFIRVIPMPEFLK